MTSATTRIPLSANRPPAPGRPSFPRAGENSLNPSLFPALVALIDHARQSSQILVITHSDALCEALVTQLDATARKLAIQKGATRFIEDLGPRKVWNFED